MTKPELSPQFDTTGEKTQEDGREPMGLPDDYDGPVEVLYLQDGQTVHGRYMSIGEVPESLRPVARPSREEHDAR